MFRDHTGLTVGFPCLDLTVQSPACLVMAEASRRTHSPWCLMTGALRDDEGIRMEKSPASHYGGLIPFDL